MVFRITLFALIIRKITCCLFTIHFVIFINLVGCEKKLDMIFYSDLTKARGRNTKVNRINSFKKLETIMDVSVETVKYYFTNS